MAKSSPELLKARREEIVAACEQLYQTMQFREITLKEIGNVTSFSRPTIYNYFETKEEIFLEIIKKEYEKWNVELNAISQEYTSLSKEAFADKIASSLEKRKQLLKILSMNLYDIEDNSRLESLVAFKKVYGIAFQKMHQLIQQFFPKTTQEEREQIVMSFFPYLFGVYPYTTETEKQREAVKQAGIAWQNNTVYELVKRHLLKCLPENEKEDNA